MFQFIVRFLPFSTYLSHYCSLIAPALLVSSLYLYNFSYKFEAMIFASCKTGDESSSGPHNRASMRTFIEEIERSGIRFRTDPRLAKVVQKLRSYRPKKGATLESINLDFEQFRYVLIID